MLLLAVSGVSRRPDPFRRRSQDRHAVIIAWPTASSTLTHPQDFLGYRRGVWRTWCGSGCGGKKGKGANDSDREVTTAAEVSPVRHPLGSVANGPVDHALLDLHSPKAELTAA